MIAQTSFQVSSPESAVILAPFGESHLRSVLPVPLQLLTYLYAGTECYLTNPNPQVFMNGESRTEGATTWGIFDPETDSNPLSPEAFVGTIALYRDEAGDGALGTGAQEAGIGIMRLGHEGKGLGTLAMLGLSQTAFAAGTRTLYARCATENIASQKVLGKTGFVKTGTPRTPVLLVGGSALPMEQWRLMSADRLAEVANTRAHAKFAAGRQTFLDAVARVAIRPLNLSSV
jgi:RimJ/RimL family protein N-acetyltransferase